MLAVILEKPVVELIIHDTDLLYRKMTTDQRTDNLPQLTHIFITLLKIPGDINIRRKILFG